MVNPIKSMDGENNNIIFRIIRKIPIVTKQKIIIAKTNKNLKAPSPI